MAANPSASTRGLRRLLLQPAFAEPQSCRGLRAIVTGAAPGSLGFETARQLAAWGAAVTVTTRRDPGRAVAALHGQVEGEVDGHALDLAQPDSVRRFAQWHADTHSRLDLLVNNAGVHLDLLSQWKQPQLTADGHEIHWRTNYLGTVQLTRLLLPALRAAAQAKGQARVVNVVSKLHAKGSNAALFEAPARYDSPYNSWAAYGTSKLALIHETFELQRRYAGGGLKAYCLHPGAVFTHIADKGLAGNPRLEALRRAFAPVERYFLLTPREGAQTTLHCATHPAAEGGRYYLNCAPAQPSADALDAQAAARLWQNTEAWVAALGG